MELIIGLVVLFFLFRFFTRSSSRALPADNRSAPARRIDSKGRSSSPRSSRAVDARWIPKEEVVEIAGHRIEGGMFYVGTNLPAVESWVGEEPALIDPTARISTSTAEIAAAAAGYWPSYSTVSPAFRAKYLRWLAGGRRAPGVDIGCVFLFFYGLERRVLIDSEKSAEARAEVPGILEEVIRLLGIYSENNSFRGHASSFLEFARARYLPDSLAPGPSLERVSFQVPLGVRIGIGRLLLQHKPISADWALAWLRSHPLVRLRTAAVRCAEEFDTLFRLRYQQKFGEGMVVPPTKTTIAIEHRPASRSFGRTFHVELRDLPDIAAVKAPLARLEKIAEQVTDELDRYSRWIGKTDDRRSPAGLALLPPELAEIRLRDLDHELLRDLRSTVPDEIPAVLPTDQVLRHWSGAGDGRLSKKEAEAVSDFLAIAKFGIEPDIRLSNVNFSRSPRVAVFRLVGEVAAPGKDYLRALLFLNLAVAVAGADEMAVVEEQELESHLEAAFRLNPAERRRLRAHLAWLRACPPSPAAVKKQLDELPAAQRESMGKVLIAIAGADGQVSPREIKVLSKIYPLLGLDPDSLYTDIHALAARVASKPGPVTVLPADPGSDFSIPRPQEAKPVRSGAVVLDAARVAAIHRETQAVTEVLAGVFSSEDDVAEEGNLGEEIGEIDQERRAADSVAGLDEAHSALIRALHERPEWPRSDFDALAERFGLMPSGAIEIINEVAFELSGEPLLEGHDPIEVNDYALQEVLV